MKRLGISVQICLMKYHSMRKDCQRQAFRIREEELC